MTNLDEEKGQEEKWEFLIPLVRQLQGGENKPNRLAAALRPNDESSCQSSSDGGNMTN